MSAKNIKILGSSNSTCTRRLMYAAAVLNVPYDLHEIDFAKGENKTPEYLAKQPWGKVPVLEQDGFVLYESRAICRYLNEVSSSHALIPSDVKQRALFEQWASIELNYLTPHFETIVYHTVWYKWHGATPDEAAIKKARESLTKPLSILDKQLSTHQYVTGDKLSLVDIWLVPVLWVMSEGAPEHHKQVIDAHPNISAWWKRVTGTPEWQKIVTAKK